MLKIVHPDGKEEITDFNVHVILRAGRIVGIASHSLLAEDMVRKYIETFGAERNDITVVEFPLNYLREIVTLPSPLMMLTPRELSLIRGPMERLKMDMCSSVQTAQISAAEMLSSFNHLCAILYGEENEN